MKERKLNRRAVLKLGATMAAGGAIGGAALLAPGQSPPADCSTTAAQPFGPFPPMKSRSQHDHDIDLTQVQGQAGKAKGEVILIRGKVLDTDCKPLAGAVVEIWQANHYGKYNHEYDPNGTHDPFFQGWGQAVSNEKGEYRFKTILPGFYANRARHIHFKVSRRGYHELVTQMYFSGEERNKTDNLLNALTHNEQQKLVKQLDRSGELPSIEFDIHVAAVLQGGVPARVLAEYNGEYVLDYKGTPTEDFVNAMLGGPYEKVIMKVENEGDLLYFTLPFAPKTQAIWKEKDVFDSNSFFRSSLRFLRNEHGEVRELEIRVHPNIPRADIIKGKRI